MTHGKGHEDGPDWAAIEKAYGTDTRKLTEIARGFGVNRQLIQARAAKLNWRRAGDGPDLDERDAGIDLDDVAKAEEASGDRRKRMVARLFRALEEKMTQMEKRIARGADGADASAADSEREARALSALAGLYAKLVELDEGANGKGAAKQRHEAAGDADHFREDLARRLERLNQARDA
ncbi:hypothetical protein A7A08_02143 [Methyloligella halotolerans]|uniref:Uncharacterized protein n=1 Tax=Methyloligella halotolerans TaxID=1177755 RepID=A0A1E2RX78_9HYPH|nr:hypothetical protein [Methyloligella halotolerans]ODA66846.1 hypothetical protein A7A08_02143 [Methyloligella halotolerans]